MSSIASIYLTGRVGNDPEASKKDDKLYASFRIAVNGFAKGEEYTDWHQVTCGGKIAETILTHVKKGDKLAIVGNPRPHAYYHQESGKIVASFNIWMKEFDFAGSAKDKEKPETANVPNSCEDEIPVFDEVIAPQNSPAPDAVI